MTLSSERKRKTVVDWQVGQQPKPKSKLFYKTQPRFDLKGALVVLEKDINQENEKDVRNATADIRKVGEREGKYMACTTMDKILMPRVTRSRSFCTYPEA